MHLIAVTGTDGKTSTVTFTRQLLVAAGLRTSSFGTDGLCTADGHTSWPPGLIGRRAILNLVRTEQEDGIDAFVLETFSTGLGTGAYDQLTVDTAAFTTLGHDHLDHHGDRVSYLAAKQRLFQHVLRPDGVAVLNPSTTPGRHLRNLVAARGGSVLEVGRTAASTIRLHRQKPVTGGTRLDLQIGLHRFTLTLPLLGGPMLQNLLLAIGLARNAGLTIADVYTALPTLVSPSGRLEAIGVHHGATVVIDTAHTPGALANALLALRPRCARELHVVVGAGGRRDVHKRPSMARVLSSLADVVTITDDNPRTEDPAAIRAALLADCPKAQEIPDRAEAIVHALRPLGPGDILLIAGRAEETHQRRADGPHQMCDRTTARAAMSDPAMTPQPPFSAFQTQSSPVPM